VEVIHFLEVGATVSFVDICGAALLLVFLGIMLVFSCRTRLVSGKIRIALGVVTVPVPGTL
jgi:uncharacterized protein (DUF111 family)